MHVCFSFVKRKQRLTISRKNEEKTKNIIVTLITTNKQQKKYRNTRRLYGY